MVIKHNLSAMNADRMFGKTEKTKSKNMESSRRVIRLTARQMMRQGFLYPRR